VNERVELVGEPCMKIRCTGVLEGGARGAALDPLRQP
jgi:hypothetical protein